jgi:hypothetical protein
MVDEVKFDLGETSEKKVLPKAKPLDTEKRENSLEKPSENIVQENVEEIKSSPETKIPKEKIKEEKKEISKVIQKKEELQKVKIKRLGAISLANTFSLIVLFLGILFTILIYLFISLVPPLEISGETSTVDPASFFSWGFFLFLNILFAVFTWISVALLTLIYNLVSKISGGVALYS